MIDSIGVHDETCAIFSKKSHLLFKIFSRACSLFIKIKLKGNTMLIDEKLKKQVAQKTVEFIAREDGTALDS
ncbi:MAG: hypothetical protein PHC99_11135, partial [Methylococcales bacterium]|nr:hypothetical protein [Methylococcales bacterium]